MLQLYFGNFCLLVLGLLAKVDHLWLYGHVSLVWRQKSCSGHNKQHIICSCLSLLAQGGSCGPQFPPVPGSAVPATAE